MLRPERIGIFATLNDHVRILHVRLELQLRRHVFCPHSLAAYLPTRAAVSGFPDAAARHCDEDALGVARIDADRMNSRLFRSAAEPGLTHGVIPQRTVQFPGLASVFGPEQAARKSSAPD